VSDPEIDAAILAVVKPSWKKVAAIAIRAADALGPEFATRDDSFSLVAARVHALATQGRLLAQGDTTQPRWSEVRQISATP
jgi:hypothetical protein